jgi:hypothetical protein
MKINLKFVVQAVAVIISIVASNHGHRVNNCMNINENPQKFLTRKKFSICYLSSSQDLNREKVMDERTLELN